jgi:hypothetical protein
MSSENNVVTEADRYTGRVKWFNKKSGYGFINVTDGPKAGNDIFVHHTSISVDGELYKYLVEGEYVQFEFTETKDEKHEFQAADVSGINRGKLMCETLNEVRSARSKYQSTKPRDVDTTTNDTVVPRSTPVPGARPSYRARGEGPRENKEGDWNYVPKRRSPVQRAVEGAPVSVPVSVSVPSTRRGRPPKKV